MASSRYQVEMTLIGAKDLKNVNWRHGPLRPYAVVWVDPNHKCSTRADPEGDSFPVWNQTLLIPLSPGTAVGDATLHVDVVHAGFKDGTKPLIGSARLRLSDVLEDDDGYSGGGRAKKRSLQLQGPSGRPQGKVDVKVAMRETRYRAPTVAYGVTPPPASREYTAPPAYKAPLAYGWASSNQYASPQPQYEQRDPYYSTAAPAGYPSYSETSYGQPPPIYGQEEKKKSKFGGMGKGLGRLAVGAVAGMLGGLALSEGVDYVENKIANAVAEKVKEDGAYQDDGVEDDGAYQYDGAYQEDGVEDDGAYQYDGAYQDNGVEDDGAYQYDGAYQEDGIPDNGTYQDDGAYQYDGAYQENGIQDNGAEDDGAYQDNGVKDNLAYQEDGIEDDGAYQYDGTYQYDRAYQDDGDDLPYQDDGDDYY